jgi:hypothetical protein
MGVCGVCLNLVLKFYCLCFFFFFLFNLPIKHHIETNHTTDHSEVCQEGGPSGGSGRGWVLSSANSSVGSSLVGTTSHPAWHPAPYRGLHSQYSHLALTFRSSMLGHWCALLVSSLKFCSGS